MSGAELEDLMLFYEAEPFGPHWDNQYRALTAALIYNANRAEGSIGLGIDDFLPLPPEVRMARKRAAVLNTFMAVAKPKAGPDA